MPPDLHPTAKLVYDASWEVDETAEPSNGRRRRDTGPTLDQAFSRPHRSDVRGVRWFWRRRIVRGQLNVLAGTQGVGKSQLAVGIAAEATRRGEAVLILSAEDEESTTITPRLIAAGADLGLVRTLRSDFSLWLPEDFGLLRQFIAESGAALAVIDPIIAFVDGDTNSWRDQDVRRVLREVRSIAKETDCTILALMHPKKGEEGEVVNVVSGAVAWTAAPRSTLLMTRALDEDGGEPADGDPRRVLFHVKCNVGREQPALQMRIEGAQVEGVETTWVDAVGENPDLRARDHVGSARRLRPQAPKREAAEAFLVLALSGGPRPASELEEVAEGEGISQATLRRARESLGVKVVRERGGWMWMMPGEESA